MVCCDVIQKRDSASWVKHTPHRMHLLVSTHLCERQSPPVMLLFLRGTSFRPMQFLDITETHSNLYPALFDIGPYTIQRSARVKNWNPRTPLPSNSLLYELPI